MTTFKTSLLAGAALLAAPSLASAQGSMGFFDNFRLAPQQTVTGLYIGAGAGANFLENGTLRSNPSLASGLRAGGAGGRGRIIYEPGFTGALSMGWGFGNGLRVEVEGNYRQNDVDKVGGFPGFGARSPAGGVQRTYGAMANVLYDFRIPGMPWVVPYIGGGAGYAWRDWDTLRFQGTGAAAISRASEGSFAYQAIGGFAFPIAQVPGLAVTAEYRYFATDFNDMNTRVIRTSGPGTGAGVAGGQLRASNENHSVLVGLRYAFNQPRPAPVVAAPVAAAPAPARTYLVFFDWDRADLTDRARQIIGDAAQNSRTVGATRIEVSGHADRTGTAVYNQRLSVRRGEAVAGELVRQGVARDQISVQGFGFDRPLVPTAMGVREPQNRRVEIVLR
ncbi:OmpA family protein [Roseococcus sp. SYP-B2431]|uniref:OmpA family protein n=1 Tax=Roseococcus sp. SYP-B2431 TaxID=2496640 RepID=UPI00103E1D4A|nr:OmpA family protein [Roseococcus sp. SYP-B2431]TCH97889.1 OmpA family protein [Roseococcus sp. SYP-B2431]